MPETVKKLLASSPAKNVKGSWRTSVAGIALAGLLVLQSFADKGKLDFSSPEMWVAVGVAVLGVIAKVK